MAKRPKKPITTPAGEASHRRGMIRLGSMLHMVTAGSSPFDSGMALDRCLEAGVKAIMPGRQTDKHIQESIVDFRKGFVRQLAAEATGANDDSGKV